MTYSGTRAGSATGSSRYQTTSGIAAANWSAVITTGTCFTPSVAADSAAMSTSQVDSRSKPTVKVIRSGLYRLASAAMAVGAIPLGGNEPTGAAAPLACAND